MCGAGLDCQLMFKRLSFTNKIKVKTFIAHKNHDLPIITTSFNIHVLPLKCELGQWAIVGLGDMSCILLGLKCKMAAASQFCKGDGNHKVW